MAKRRRRFRFSIRTMLIWVTLVGAYPACWGPTKKQGHIDAWEQLPMIDPVSSKVPPTMLAPLLLEYEVFPNARWKPVRRYYIWFFGHIVKLPFERHGYIPECDPGSPDCRF